MIIILTGDLLRGHTDAIILFLLKAKDSYGYELNQKLADITNNHFSLTEATLYTTFKRLENNGFLVSYWSDGINTKRKYYSITDAGLKHLSEYKKSYLDANKILNKIFEGEF